MTEKTQALAVPVGNFVVLSEPIEALSEILEANIGDGSISAFDLDCIKVPAGGGTMWTIPTLEGEEDVKEILGIIVHWRDGRSYWKESFDETGGGTPPDCSGDGKVGTGVPGGYCSQCAFAKFGTAGKGHGQACKQQRYVFLVTEGGIIPFLLICPPTSLEPIKKYLLRLTSAKKPYYSVVTRFALIKDKNKDGIQFSKLAVGMAGALSEEQTAKIKAYADKIRPALDEINLTEAEYAEGEEYPEAEYAEYPEAEYAETVNITMPDEAEAPKA